MTESVTNWRPLRTNIVAMKASAKIETVYQLLKKDKDALDKAKTFPINGITFGICVIHPHPTFSVQGGEWVMSINESLLSASDLFCGLAVTPLPFPVERERHLKMLCVELIRADIGDYALNIRVQPDYIDNIDFRLKSAELRVITNKYRKWMVKP